jgi:hypothetical protein
MGFFKKEFQVERGLKTKGKKWVIAGIPLCAPLKPIYKNPVDMSPLKTKAPSG